MHSLVQRALIGISVAALGAGLLGAAAPAYADEPGVGVEPQHDEVHATAEYRTVQHDVDLLGTPRLGTPALTRLRTGMPVTAFCAFVSDGQTWVKVQHTAQYGFVPMAAVGGKGSLPSTCPSEVETIEVLVFNHLFRFGETGVPINAWRCPDSRPYLSNDDYHRDAFVPQGVRITGWGTGIHTLLGGTMLQSTKHGGKSYAAGFKATTVTNWGGEQLGQVYVTCTANIARAYEKDWPEPAEAVNLD